MRGLSMSDVAFVSVEICLNFRTQADSFVFEIFATNFSYLKNILIQNVTREQFQPIRYLNFV